MSDLANRIAARELMIYEETVRLNADRAQIRVLAPGAWEELKQAFQDECDAISSQVKLLQLECEQDGEHSFLINRSRGYGPAIGALSFTFDPAIPCIVWQDHANKKLRQVISFAVDGTGIVLVSGKRALILARFVENCLSAIAE